MGWERCDLGEHSIWDVADDLITSYEYAVFSLMKGPSWSAAAIYVNAGDEPEKSTIWLSPKAVELMKPLPIFVDCGGPRPDEVHIFLGAGYDFDPVTVEMPDDLRPQIIYPGVVEHRIAHEVSERMSFMAGGTTYEAIAEFPLEIVWKRPVIADNPQEFVSLLGRTCDGQSVRITSEARRLAGTQPPLRI